MVSGRALARGGHGGAEAGQVAPGQQAVPVDGLEQQLAELKRTEATLSSTLLSAQSLAEDVKRNAQREADLVIKEAEQKAGELIHQARVELTDTQRDLTSLQKQRLLMVERLRASLRMFERMLEVEEQEAFHDAATVAEEKLEGESSPRL